MSGPTAEWGKEVIENVTKLTDQVKDVARDVKALAVSVDEFKVFKKEAEKSMNGLSVARWVTGVIGSLVLLGIATLLYRFGAIEDRVSVHNDSIAKIDRAVTELGRPTRFQPTAHGDSYAYHEHVGKIERITSNEIVIISHADGPFKTTVTLSIAPGARILVKDHAAKLADLKPGMTVRVLHNDGNKVQLIETIDEEKMPPKR